VQGTGGAEIFGAVFGALALVLASATLGIVANHQSSQGIPIFPEPGAEASGPQLPLPPGLLPISLEEAHAAFAEGAALFLDARPEEEYHEAHIPGALNIVPSSFEEHYLDDMDEIDAASQLVTYCNGLECSDSIELAERLQEVFTGPIYVLEAGWRAWEQAGYSERTGSEP
jgi:rhodanese-related sulfurtransferase